MKIKRILKWTALAIVLILFAWFEFAYWTSTNDCDQKTGAPTHPMKAIRYCEYGPPDEVLKLEPVGQNVTEFKPGDEVFGVRAGALAEYICVTASRAVVSKPGNVTFEQAASIPTALV